MNTVDLTGHIDNSFWKSLFAADSIAVIGANNNSGSWGYNALRSAMATPPGEAKKQVYAVNPSLREVQGITSYNNILDIPGPVELAIIVVRADIVPSVLRQCVQKKVKAAVIISAGFAEVDAAGARLQAELLEIAAEGGMHFVGPNCMGHADMFSRVASAGVFERTKPGPMSLITQSGTLGASIIQLAGNNGVGISKLVSTGNEASVHLEDYLEYLEQDESTKIIASYIEGLREGRRFFQLSKRITAKKPIIAIKTGTTAQSSQAAKSHTGALAGSDAIYSAAFKQTGVIRAEDEEELSDVAVALLNQPLPRGNRIAIITIGGGFGVITAEACEKEGLKIASLEPETLEKLSAILPPRWSHGNPVDLVGINTKAEDTTVPSALSLLLQDKNVDAIISLVSLVSFPYGPPGTISPEQIKALQTENQKRLDSLLRQIKQSGKPVIMVRWFASPPTGGSDTPPSAPRERIPEYAHPRRAARVLRHLVWYRQYLDSSGDNC